MAQKVTEEEAKKKWCRHGRRYSVVSTSEKSAAIAVNRGEHGHASTVCFGTHCMAWEWDEEENVLKGLKGDERRGFCDAENNGGKVAIL